MTSNTQTPTQKLQHIPVLLEKTVELLAPKPGDTYLDLTAGRGGHARVVIERIGSAALATLVDRDTQAIDSLSSFARNGAHIIHSDFATATEQLHRTGQRFNVILIDLGVSSPQLDDVERGFSFVRSGPLDMRMDQTQRFTAAELVNTATEAELADIIYRYGQEPQARRIARSIVERRPFFTTGELAETVANMVRGNWGKTHPATRTFQAIRIAVNDELGQLERTLNRIPDLLEPGGRVGVISFHSLEDGLVKKFFKEQAESGYEAELQLLTKKPIKGELYDVHNPRARSANLRAAVKINTNRKDVP